MVKNMEDDNLEWQKIFEQEVLEHSEIISDKEMKVNSMYIRIRELKCNDKHFVHITVDGNCIYCEKVKE